MNWQCCLKRRPGEGKYKMHLPLVSSWGRLWIKTLVCYLNAVGSFCLFVCYFGSVGVRRKLPNIEHYYVQLLMFLRLRCCNFCWLSILLFLLASVALVQLLFSWRKMEMVWRRTYNRYWVLHSAGENVQFWNVLSFTGKSCTVPKGKQLCWGIPSWTQLYCQIYKNVSTTCFGPYGHLQVGHEVRWKNYI